MADDAVLLRLGLRGQAEVSRGLQKVTRETKDLGIQATVAGEKVRAMGAKFARGIDNASIGLGRFSYAAQAGALGLVGLGAAGVKWGLGFNSQVEQARLRFQLFTTDVNGLTKSVQAIDRASMFNFADLADAAALLGGSGIKDVPGTLQAAANAAAGGGKGTEGLKSIVLALSQIQSKGRLSQEEVNQLTEGGAITAQRDLAQGLHLTAKQLQNLGGQGIEAKKALDVLTKAWTSGKMAGAARRQLGTLAGQWGLFTGSMQKLAGKATEGLTAGLEHGVLPAANRAVDQINAIFGDRGLTNHQKFERAKRVIVTELGPVWQDVRRDIDKADIPGHLGMLVGAAVPRMAAAAGDAGPAAARAFVDAWLRSGPWAQFLSAAYLAKKLGAFGLAGKALSRGGGGAGGAGGGLFGRGGSPANPLWVAMVDKVSGAPSLAKRAGPVATIGRVGAAVLGLAGLGFVGHEAGGLVTRGADALAGGDPHRRDVNRGIAKTLVGGPLLNTLFNFPHLSDNRASLIKRGLLPAPAVQGAFAQGAATFTFQAPFVLQMDSRTVAQGNATAVAKQKARTR